MKMVRDEGAIGWIRKFTVGAMAQPAKIGFGSGGQSSDTSGKHFRGYLGQAARSFAAMSLYSASDSFLLGAGVPGAFPPKEGMT